VTTLDGRFSDPASSPTSWEAVLQALDEAQMFWLTTVRTDGRPHVTPLVAVWLDDAIYFCTGAGEQKAHNLRENSHVILTTGCDQWDGGLDVVVEGDATRVTDDARLEQLARAWTNKWDGRWQYVVRDGSLYEAEGDAAGEGDGALLFSVIPTKVLAFGKGTFSQTCHRF
jgi:general stress protein 26